MRGATRRSEDTQNLPAAKPVRKRLSQEALSNGGRAWCTLRTMRGLLYAAVGLVLTAVAFGIVYKLAPAAEPSKPDVRSIAFDNVYGNVERLRVFVSVDNLAEQTVAATCDPTTCIFKLPLTNARHDLLL